MIVDMDREIKTLSREILLALWKIHILHHAQEGPVVDVDAEGAKKPRL